MVVDVDVVEKIIEVKGNVLIIRTKEILHTTRSGITLSRNKMKTKVYRINLQRNMKINATGCGIKGHWSCTCRTPKHLVNLYQASTKGKENEIEMNFADHSNPEDSQVFLDTQNGEGNTHLDVSNFFIDSNTKSNLLISDEYFYNY